MASRSQADPKTKIIIASRPAALPSFRWNRSIAHTPLRWVPSFLPGSPALKSHCFGTSPQNDLPVCVALCALSRPRLCIGHAFRNSFSLDVEQRHQRLRSCICRLCCCPHPAGTHRQIITAPRVLRPHDRELRCHAHTVLGIARHILCPRIKSARKFCGYLSDYLDQQQ